MSPHSPRSKEFNKNAVEINTAFDNIQKSLKAGHDKVAEARKIIKEKRGHWDTVAGDAVTELNKAGNQTRELMRILLRMRYDRSSEEDIAYGSGKLKEAGALCTELENSILGLYKE